MKTHSLIPALVIAMTPILLADAAIAAVPPVEKAGVAAPIQCPTATTDRIWHFDKIIFQIGAGSLIPIKPEDANALNALPRSTPLDIKVRDNPAAVADLKSKVLSFLGAQPANTTNRQLIRIEDVDYVAILCPKPL